MFNQYLRQQNIDSIEKATYTRLKYWDRMHCVLFEAEKPK